MKLVKYNWDFWKSNKWLVRYVNNCKKVYAH